MKAGSLKGINFILYVADQTASTKFYAFVLDLVPVLNVPGMTEFELPGKAVLGLMPVAGIRRLLGNALPDTDWSVNFPRAELYFTVENALPYYQRALEAGARELSKISARDWGHEAGYVLDPDGHVIAFSQPIRQV